MDEAYYSGDALSPSEVPSPPHTDAQAANTRIFRFRFCLLFNRFTTREVELEDALGGQQGLGFTRMYTRMARVIDPTQVSPVPL